MALWVVLARRHRPRVRFVARVGEWGWQKRPPLRYDMKRATTRLGVGPRAHAERSPKSAGPVQSISFRPS